MDRRARLDDRHPPLTALYDAECEICQAAVSWIEALDRRGAVRCAAVQDGPVEAVHPALSAQECLAQLHVVDANGGVTRGWPAVVRLSRVLPWTRPLAALDHLAWTRRAADRCYAYIARNRHQLSTCRGGACPPGGADWRTAAAPFWTCYSLGLALRLPLVAAVGARDQARYLRDYARTRRRRIQLLDQRLELWFLGGWPADLVPLVFGERFCAVWYRGLLVDPGSARMRRSLAAHLRAAASRGQRVAAVTATHHHEEHVGNLEWAARRAAAPVMLADGVAARLRPAAPIPRARGLVIGQPPSLRGPVRAADASITAGAAHLDVIEAPGHSPDHVVVWDPDERALLVGDAFMGAYFSSPNPDVDSRAWITTLKRLLDLDISIMVEGHGHVRTLRPDIRPVPGVVLRQDPRAEIARKIEFLTWLRARIAEARAEGRSDNAAVASCFPWGRRWSWERLVADEVARAGTAGEFSRHELVRSFYRTPGDVLPNVLEATFTAKQTAP